MSMLFTPYEVGNLHLEDRIVLPPMATFRAQAAGGHRVCSGQHRGPL